MRSNAAKTLITVGVMALPGGIALAALAPDLFAFVLLSLRLRLTHTPHLPPL